MEYGFKVDDLYNEMLGKDEYRCGDGYHYNDLGKIEQGKIEAFKIRESIK